MHSFYKIAQYHHTLSEDVTRGWQDWRVPWRSPRRRVTTTNVALSSFRLDQTFLQTPWPMLKYKEWKSHIVPPTHKSTNPRTSCTERHYHQPRTTNLAYRMSQHAISGRARPDLTDKPKIGRRGDFAALTRYITRGGPLHRYTWFSEWIHVERMLDKAGEGGAIGGISVPPSLPQSDMGLLHIEWRALY